MPGNRVKNWPQYEALRRKGLSKESSARITNAGRARAGGSEGGKKETKSEANYRPGSPVRRCGLCAHFIPGGGARGARCEKVAGSVGEGAVSDYFKRKA